MIKEITIGSDFEVFVFNKNVLIECDILLPTATKSEPINYKGYIITHDRKSLECAIPPFIWNGSYNQIYQEINKGLSILEEFIKIIDNNNYLVLKDFQLLDESYSWTKSSENNVYLGKTNSYLIINSIVTNGLHLHFSGISNNIKLIKDLDKTIGLYYKVISLFSKRSDYGKLGSYKNKNYGNLIKGFEYRTLGGKMIKTFNLIITSIIVNLLLKFRKY